MDSYEEEEEEEEDDGNRDDDDDDDDGVVVCGDASRVCMSPAGTVLVPGAMCLPTGEETTIRSSMACPGIEE